MTKQDSLIIKGFTILMMLWGHLFYTGVSANYTFWVHGEPLAKLLCRACSPVPFFLILGGYGLYKVYEKGDKSGVKRILKLYAHYFVIFSIAIGIAVGLLGKVWYINSAKVLIYNLTGYWTTINAEMWFLLPYTCLSLLSSRIFKTFEKINGLAIIGCSFIIYLGTSYVISRHGAEYLFHNMWLYNPFLVLHFMFYFLTGAIFAREKWFEKINIFAADSANIRYFAGGGILVIVAVEMVFRYNFLYPVAAIICLQLVAMPSILRNFLALLGTHSMNMWMIHTWLCYYLFHDFIYWFKYPLLIFAVLTLLSLGSSIAVNSIMSTLGKFKNLIRSLSAREISYK